MSLNKVFLMGNLGADPELRSTQNGTQICTLRVATNEKRRNSDGTFTDHTEWHTVITFGKTAENCAQYLQKGRSIFVEGRIQTRKYQDQDGKDRYFTEIIANTVQFIGGGRGEGMSVERVPANRADSERSSAGTLPVDRAAIESPVSFDDDDIPF